MSEDERVKRLLDEVIRARSRINFLLMYGPEGFVHKELACISDVSSDSDPPAKKMKTPDRSRAGGTKDPTHSADSDHSTDSDDFDE